MARIKIIALPAGSAPEEISNQWLDVVIPLLKGETSFVPTICIGMENQGGYIVLASDAIAALVSAGKHEATEYWKELPLGSLLEFPRDICEFIPDDELSLKKGRTLADLVAELKPVPGESLTVCRVPPRRRPRFG